MSSLFKFRFHILCSSHTEMHVIVCNHNRRLNPKTTSTSHTHNCNYNPKLPIQSCIYFTNIPTILKRNSQSAHTTTIHILLTTIFPKANSHKQQATSHNRKLHPHSPIESSTRRNLRHNQHHSPKHLKKRFKKSCACNYN